MTVSTPTTNADSAIQQQQSSSSSSSAIPTTIKAVIFDLDGTLLDTESLSCRAVIESFAATNLAIPKDILDSLKDGGLLLLPWELKRRILGMRGSEWVPIVLGYAQLKWGVEMTSSLDWKSFWEQPSTPTAAATTTTDDDDDDDTKARETMVNAFWKAWEVGLNRLCSQVEACPGAVELVEALRAARVPMAIATSSRAASVRKKRANHDAIFRSIRQIVSGDDPAVKNGKPAPDIYLEAAKRLGVPPERCLVFEDAYAGARSGKAAGCHVVAVPDKRMEKSVYEDVSEEIIEDLWMFSGKRWGIDVEMKELR